MKKVLAGITILGCPLGCLINAVAVIGICITLLFSCTSQVAQFVTNPTGSVVSIAVEAVKLASRLRGNLAQEYDPKDPQMQDAIHYWEKTCQNPDGSLCKWASSGNLQCVEFVTGAFAMAGISLPAAPDAHLFWGAYKGLAGWREVPMRTGLPQSGDIIVWRNQVYNKDTGQMEEGLGHVAVVVAVIPPQHQHSGAVYIAQANAPNNTTVQAALSDTLGKIFRDQYQGTLENLLDARLNKLSINADLSIPSSPDYEVLGFIRHVTPPEHLPTPDDLKNRLAHAVEPQWIAVAWRDALKYGISPTYFVKQIYLESQFDPNAVSHDPDPPHDPIAYGIAQFTPPTAAGMGINYWDADQSLDAAARLMRRYYDTYLGTGTTALARSNAYAKALAAYNGGPGVVSGSVARCGEAHWFSCLGDDVKNYLRIVAN